MSKIAIITDSNSGITQTQAKELGVFVIPTPFMINDETYFEDISLTKEEFYAKLNEDEPISTSQPSPADTLKLWEEVLQSYDEIVHIPISSGLSGACQTAAMLADDFDGRVQVVNNQRISVTLRQSVLDAIKLAEQGKNAAEIKEILEHDKFNSSIYIMLDTLYYLKKGGRITPAAAAIGMINAVKSDMENRFGGFSADNFYLAIAHTDNEEAAKAFKEEVAKEFPGVPIYIDSLSLSVSCHIGPGSLALACCKRLV